MYGTRYRPGHRAFLFAVTSPVRTSDRVNLQYSTGYKSHRLGNVWDKVQTRSSSVTEELVRKKSEHNDCEIFSLEEISLHQENIERIEYIDKWCRQLKILYLQSNLIPKIENVGRLKKLEYLNLALNNIERIENLEGCESLQKLDLTVNFVGELTSLESLKDLVHFKDLFLVGNPCAQYEGFKEYVIATLPQLKTLDGIAIEKSERILAVQDYGVIRARIIQQQLEYQKKREKEKEEERKEAEQAEKEEEEKKPGNGNTWYTDINEEDREKRRKKESEDMEKEYAKDKEFFQEKTAFTPESRVKTHQKMEEIKSRDRKREEAKNPPKAPRQYFAEDGRAFNVNEPKIDFTLTEDDTGNNILLDYQCFKYLDTSLIDVDVQPKYVRITAKGKIFQLCLDEEVNADASKCQRSQVTGHLLVSMPKSKQVVKPVPKQQSKEKPSSNKENEQSSKNKSGPRVEKLEVDANAGSKVDIGNIVQDKPSKVVPPLGSRPVWRREERANSEQFVDDPDVPPLE